MHLPLCKGHLTGPKVAVLDRFHSAFRLCFLLCIELKVLSTQSVPLSVRTENIGRLEHLPMVYRCVMSPLCSPPIPSDTGLWKGGKFLFEVSIPEEYNMKVCVLMLVTYLHQLSPATSM